MEIIMNKYFFVIVLAGLLGLVPAMSYPMQTPAAHIEMNEDAIKTAEEYLSTVEEIITMLKKNIYALCYISIPAKTTIKNCLKMIISLRKTEKEDGTKKKTIEKIKTIKKKLKQVIAEYKSIIIEMKKLEPIEAANPVKADKIIEVETDKE